MSSTRANRRAGALWGLALGDALGIPEEMHSAEKIAARHPDGGPWGFRDSVRTNGESWSAGDISDDTEQALSILEAKLNPARLTGPEERVLAQHFATWLADGGKGSGGHTRRVLQHPDFLSDPFSASLAVWDRGLDHDPGEKPAANGGVMRTTGVSVLHPWDLSKVVSKATRTCQVTHWDPRCVASAVAVSVAQSCLIMGWEIPYAIEEARSRATRVHAGVSPFLDVDDLSSLELDQKPYSYTYKTVGAGFWALRNYLEHQEVLGSIQGVIRAGGDTDTNAAVAGALLGSHVGTVGLPQDLLAGLTQKDRIKRVLDRIVLRYGFPHRKAG